MVAYCEAMEEEMIPQEDIYLKDEVLFSKEQINRYRASNAILSIQTKIDGLNERTLVKLRNELTGHDLIYTPEERKALVKSLTGRFGPKKWKKPIFEIYDEFCQAQKLPYQRTAVPDLDVKGSSFQAGSVQGGKKAVLEKVPETSGEKKGVGRNNRKKKREIIGYDVYDLAALAYIYKRCKETERIQD